MPVQVTEKSVAGLKREFTVKVPANDIDQKVSAKLVEVGKQVNLPGFRPGKAPAAVVKKRYGQSVQGEVLEAAVSESMRDLLSERGLRPALQPKVEVTSFGEGKDLEYNISLEVIPEITPVDLKTIKIERLSVVPDDAAIEKTIKDLAAMRKPTKKVETNRAAKLGDTLLIDFDGKVDGERRDGMKGEGHKLELGSKSFIDTFEDQLVGTKAGDKKLVKVTFPKDYGAAELAGKDAEFDVTVHELHEATEVILDDTFAKSFGFDDLAKLKEQIGQNLTNQYKQAARLKSKRLLLDELAKAHSFDVPQNMVDYEFDAIWKQRTEQGPDPEEKGTTEDEIKAEYRTIAERRVRLGLLLAEIGRKNSIDVTQQELQNAVFEQARQYRGQERMVVEYFSKNQDALNSLRAPLFEDKVVDYIFELVTINEKTGTPDDLKAEADE